MDKTSLNQKAWYRGLKVLFFLMFISAQIIGIYFANEMAEERIDNLEIELSDKGYEKIGDAVKEYYAYKDIDFGESISLGSIAYHDNPFDEYDGLLEIMYGIDFGTFWANSGLSKSGYTMVYELTSFWEDTVVIKTAYFATLLIAITLSSFIIAMLSFYIMGGMELVSEQLNSIKRIIKKQKINGKPI